MPKTREYWEYVLNSNKPMYEETEKRLKYTPFDADTFVWYLIYEPSPLFIVLRDMLRRGNYRFQIAVDPTRLARRPYTSILTPWSAAVGDAQITIRGQLCDRMMMGLYYEAGDWDCPQQNFLFDWSEDQAIAYLIDRELLAYEDVVL